MLKRETTHQVLSSAIVLYACFVVVTLVGVFVWEPLLMPAVFTWPYPFLLSAQHYVSDPAGAQSWVVALVLGLVLVAFCAWAVQRAIAQKATTRSQQWGLAILSIVCPLGIVTGVTWAVAWAVGWPLGE